MKRKPGRFGHITFAIGVLVTACSSSTGGGPAEGDERGPCFPNGTCNAGLSCKAYVGTYPM